MKLELLSVNFLKSLYKSNGNGIFILCIKKSSRHIGKKLKQVTKSAHYFHIGDYF